MPIKQYITSKTIIKNNGDSCDFVDSINVSCPFLVKRIRFNFAYAYQAAFVMSLVINASVNSYHSVVAILSTVNRVSGVNVSYAKDLENDAATEIVFNDPIQIHEEVRLNFDANTANPTFNLNNSAILCRVECYSE
jgi:hypothetical protein